MAPKVSACIVAYHEENVIERCLRSLADVVDEIVLVHDGECEDKTLVIAEKYGAKIFVRPRLGIAEGHRIFSFQQATGDWIFLVDSDEYLSEELRQNLRSLVEKSDADAFEFVWPIWNGSRYLTKGWPFRLALFRRSQISYWDFPQEAPKTLGKIQRTCFVLEHRPLYFNLSLKSLLQKHRKWAKIHASAFQKRFDETERLNYPQKDWSIKYKFFRRVPILFPLLACIVFVRTYFTGGFRQGYWGFRFCLNTAIYYGLVFFYFFRRHPFGLS